VRIPEDHRVAGLRDASRRRLTSNVTIDPTAGGEPTVMRSLFAKEPRPEVVVGKGSSNFVFLSRLATACGDRLVKNALGFAAALRPKT
jgi:hypothetical protein